MNKKQKMNEQILHHGFRLIEIFDLSPFPETYPVKLCKSLRRIENKVHRAAEDYCNGTIDGDEMDKVSGRALDSLDRLLGFRNRRIPVIINQDPRGYALKISDKYVREYNIDIYRDLGGYGILAPDFS